MPGNVRNDEDIQLYLNTLAATGSVVKARAAVRTSKATIDRIREADPEFAAAEDEARDEHADMLEQELYRRAVEGEQTAMFDKENKLTGYKITKSDTLLIFALKGAKPDKYADRQKTEIAGRNGEALFDETSAAARMAAIFEAARQRKEHS